MNKLTCGIVRDLLPSYVDGLTCEETNEAVEMHVEECQECSEILKMMQAPEEATVQVEEVDYLKKVRRSWIKRAIIIGLVLMLCGVSALAYRVFWIGYEIPASHLKYQVIEEGDFLQISGNLGNSNMGISRITYERESDVIRLEVFTAPKTFFNESDFHTSVSLSNEMISEIRLNGTLLWENGEIIHKKVALLYGNLNPYVGDMSANAKLAGFLFDTENSLGYFRGYGQIGNELQTSSEPYGWKLIMMEEPKKELDAFCEYIRADSFAFLATIDNLGYVEWEFKINGEKYNVKFTEEDATVFVGSDIKSWAESASKLQELCEMLNII